MRDDDGVFVPPPIEADGVGLREHVLTLTPSQRRFVDVVVRWCRRPRKTLVVVTGGPGTGKSHVVRKTLDHVRAEQLRMSYTARSARAIGGQTIHSAVQLNYASPRVRELEKALEEEEDLCASVRASSGILAEFKCFRDPDVVVVDEVSMVKGWLMYWLLRFFMQRTARPLLFVAMGDPHQLSPVKCRHNLFSFDFDQRCPWSVETVRLKENKRFEPGYARLVDELRASVDARDEEALFDLVRRHFPVVEEMDWTMVSRADRAMASKNDWVDTFNRYYLRNMVAGTEVVVDEDLTLKPGCLVCCTENGATAANGTELLFEAFPGDRVVCTDPKTRERVELRRGSRGRFCLTLGFAATVHRFQGETLDDAKVIVHFGGSRDANLVYTALSRVRKREQILAICL